MEECRRAEAKLHTAGAAGAAWATGRRSERRGRCANGGLSQGDTKGGAEGSAEGSAKGWCTTVFPSLMPVGRQEVVLLEQWLRQALVEFMQQQGQQEQQRQGQQQGQGQQGQGQVGARARGGCTGGVTVKGGGSGGGGEGGGGGAGGTGGVAAGSSEEQRRLETFEGAMELYSVALNELVRQTSCPMSIAAPSLPLSNAQCPIPNAHAQCRMPNAHAQSPKHTPCAGASDLGPVRRAGPAAAPGVG